MGAATHLVFSQQPVGYTSEGVLVTQPIVQALDAGNAVDATYTGIVTLTPSVTTSQFYTTSEKFKTTHTVQAGSTTTALTLSPALTFDPSLPANYSGIHAGIIFTSGAVGLNGSSRYIASNTGTTVANLAGTPLSVTPSGGETVVVRSGVMFDSQAVACVAGVATFSALSLSGHQPTALVASSPGLTSATSNTLNPTGTFDGAAELPRVTVDTSEPVYEGVAYTINPANSDVAPNFKTHASALAWFIANDSPTARLIKTKGAVDYDFVTLLNRTPGKGLLHFEWDGIALSPGQRAIPANMVGCPRVTTKDNTSGCLGIEPYTGGNTAYNYRFTGYDFQVQTPTNPNATFILEVMAIWDGVGNTVAGMPQGIGFNHCLVRGTSGTYLQRAVYLGCKDFFFTNGTVADAHGTTGDEQAFIAAGTCQGPLLIKNSYNEAGGEIILSGGADTAVPGLVCSDVQVLGCHSRTPLAWKRTAVGIYVIGQTWQKKNLTEFKSGRRWLLDGNVYENEWFDGQNVALVVGSASQSGTSPWQGNRDLVIRNTTWRNICQWATLTGENAGGSGGFGSQVLGRRITLRNNLAVVNNLNGTPYSNEPDTAPKNLFVSGGIRSLRITHNTIVGDPTMSSSSSAINCDDPPFTDCVFSYNILSFPHYGITGSSGGFYGAQFSNAFQGGCAKNVLLDLDPVYNAPFSSYDPTWGNSTYATVGFADPTIHTRVRSSTFLDLVAAFTLTSGSLYNAAHAFTGDGADAGCDMAALAAAIASSYVPGEGTLLDGIEPGGVILPVQASTWARPSLVLPTAPQHYSVEDQAALRRALALALQQCLPAQPKQAVTGAKGSNAALTSLTTALVNLGLIVDQTT